MTVPPFDLALDARTAVRIVCGAFFLPHTIAKLRNIDRASILFDKVGFRPARPFVLLTTAMELVAAFGLISGLYPRGGGRCRDRASRRRLRHRPRPCPDVAVATSGHRIHGVLGHHLPCVGFLS